MPWPGFEPGLPRPQRGVLTTRRSRLAFVDESARLHYCHILQIDKIRNKRHFDLKRKLKVPASFELATFCVLSRRDNHYTTEPVMLSPCHLINEITWNMTELKENNEHHDHISQCNNITGWKWLLIILKFTTKIRKSRFRRVSNSRPSACKADVITTTPRNRTS